jgi:hypothetical protein
MNLYVARVFDWITIIEAEDKREAVRVAKPRAPGAALMPTDLNPSRVRKATDDEIAWYQAMGGVT